MLPGAGIGAAAGVMAGLMSILAGLPFGLVIVNLLGFGIPMALFGGGYTVLCARGTLRLGVFAPAALYWLIAFPLARVIQEGMAGLYLDGRPGLSDDPLSFVLYNAMLAPGLAFGFLWLHEKLVPPWVIRIRDHNPLAAGLAQAYVAYAARVYEQKERREARREAMRAARARSKA
jgi:hypothetical protein